MNGRPIGRAHRDLRSILDDMDARLRRATVFAPSEIAALDVALACRSEIECLISDHATRRANHSDVLVSEKRVSDDFDKAAKVLGV
jgi:hypothetical protein